VPTAEEDRPILLLGVHRSGTTLLSQMLGSHPQIGWLGEFEYALDPHPADDGLLGVEAYRAWLPRDRRFRAQGFEVDPHLDSRTLIRSFLAQARARSGKAQIGASLHRHFERVPRLWPHARIIHLVRDGRDVALSRVGMGWAGNSWAACGHWREIEEAWDRLAGKLSSDSHVELRFEDLVRDPETALARLADFLGVGFDAEMLRYPARSSYGRPDPSLIEQWRGRCSEAELARMEAEIGSMLHRRGYAPSGPRAKAPGRVARIVLRCHDKACRVRFRLRRYGPWLVGADFFARRLGLGRLHRRLQGHIDTITERHLR